jgi:hypothetical protein
VAEACLVTSVIAGVRMFFGGAAVHRCDNCIALVTALSRRGKASFNKTWLLSPNLAIARVARTLLSAHSIPLPNPVILSGAG